MAAGSQRFHAKDGPHPGGSAPQGSPVVVVGSHAASYWTKPEIAGIEATEFGAGILSAEAPMDGGVGSDASGSVGGDVARFQATPTDRMLQF